MNKSEFLKKLGEASFATVQAHDHWKYTSFSWAGVALSCAQEVGLPTEQGGERDPIHWAVQHLALRRQSSAEGVYLQLEDLVAIEAAWEHFQKKPIPLAVHEQ